MESGSPNVVLETERVDSHGDGENVLPPFLLPVEIED
jgi:hypothetical protein